MLLWLNEGKIPAAKLQKLWKKKKKEVWLLCLQMISSGLRDEKLNNPIQPSGKCIYTELTRDCKQVCQGEGITRRHQGQRAIYLAPVSLALAL